MQNSYKGRPEYLLIMVQRGVDLPSLDVTYFTSLSYYILLLFGLRGVFMLFFRENTIDETQVKLEFICMSRLHIWVLQHRVRLTLAAESTAGL